MLKPIEVTQSDIDAADPESDDRNCVALAIRRIRRRHDVRAYAYLGIIRIGRRRYEMSNFVSNRIIIHRSGVKITPFIFELPDTYMMKA